MSIKLVVLDIDGTLLRGKWKLHPENVKAVKKLQQNNIKVLLATGRSLYYGLKIAYKLRIQYYTKVVILYNGGLILKINPDFTREILKENFFDNESSNYLFQLATQLKIGFIGYSVEEFEKAYINKLSKLRLILRLWILKNFNKLKLVTIANDSLIPGKCAKILFYCFNKEKTEKLVNFISSDSRFEITKTRYKYIVEVNPVGVNKKTAVQWLSEHEHWKIKKEETMACGDAMNDYEIIKWCKYGIAMKNSDPELKKNAYYVTKSNKKAGVAFAINKFIFEKKE